MELINFNTDKKINEIIKTKGLTVENVINNLKKLNCYSTLELYESLKFKFDNESMEILIAIRNYYSWIFSKDYKNKLAFHNSNFKYTMQEINKKYRMC